MTYLKMALSLCSILLITGCAQLAPVVTPDHQIDPTKTYVYGGFSMIGVGAAGVALEITGVDNKNVYLIKLRKDSQPTLIEVIPGTYKISKFVALSLGNKIEGSGFLSGSPYDQEFKIESGKVYYVGDHKGKYSFSGNLTLSWGVEFGGNNYEKTTRLLDIKYPMTVGVNKLSIFKN